MKPTQPWPGSEGYSDRDQEWLEVIEDARKRIQIKRFFFTVFFLFGLLMYSVLNGQDNTLVITNIDGTSVILDIYNDETLDGHYYIMGQEGFLAEIWTTDNEWVIKATTESGSADEITIPELVGENYELLNYDIFEALPDE